GAARSVRQTGGDFGPERLDLLHQLVTRARPETDAAVADAHRAELPEACRHFLSSAGARVGRELEARRAHIAELADRPDLDPRVAPHAGTGGAREGDRRGQPGAGGSRGQPAVAALGRGADGGAGGTADPDGRPRLLHGPRTEAEVVHRPGGPVVVGKLVREGLGEEI